MLGCRRTCILAVQGKFFGFANVTLANASTHSLSFRWTLVILKLANPLCKSFIVFLALHSFDTHNSTDDTSSLAAKFRPVIVVSYLALLFVARNLKYNKYPYSSKFDPDLCSKPLTIWGPIQKNFQSTFCPGGCLGKVVSSMMKYALLV